MAEYSTVDHFAAVGQADNSTDMYNMAAYVSMGNAFILPKKHTTNGMRVGIYGDRRTMELIN